MNVVVTGAAGFIGSSLTDALLARGDSVVGLDSFDSFYARNVKERNLAGAMGQDGFRLIEGDIRDPEALDQAFAKPVDRVVHLAARAGVRPSIEDPVLYQDVNINGTS
ncbi:MAG: GDP-mannose 4,6-dehydratase, partial [Planctomycetota bacterium]